MSYALLALCLSIISFSVVASIVAAASALVHRRCADRIERLPARDRASAYLWLRLAPTTSGLAFAVLFVLPAFFLFEPQDSGERITASVVGLTLIASIPLLLCLRDGVTAWRATRARAAAWRAGADPLQLHDDGALPAFVVDTPFPVVAVVGVLRPYMIVSREVLATCNDDELAAIVAHEATHVAHRDNLKRMLMLATPDALTGTTVARDLELRWQQASEEIADNGAGSRRAIDLAAALVKVARLAQGHPAPPATMAAFCRGGDIARRVARLTAAPSPRPSRPPRSRWLLGLALTSAVALAVSAGSLQKVHAVTELLVNFLQ